MLNFNIRLNFIHIILQYSYLCKFYDSVSIVVGEYVYRYFIFWSNRCSPCWVDKSDKEGLSVLWEKVLQNFHTGWPQPLTWFKGQGYCPAEIAVNIMMNIWQNVAFYKINVYSCSEDFKDYKKIQCRISLLFCGLINISLVGPGFELESIHFATNFTL